MGTKLKDFTASAAFTSTCSVVGSDSSDPTGSFFWTKAKFDAVYPQLAAATNIFTGNLQTQNVFIPGFGAIGTDVNEIRWTDGATGTTRLYSTGERDLRMATAVGGGYSSWRMSVGMMVVGNDAVIGWPNTFNADSAPDTAIGRASAGVVEVNNGTAGVLADLQARNIPFLLKLTGVDLTAAATTDIFTVPAGKRLVVTAAQVVFTTVTALTVGATVGILDSGTAATILGNQTIANTVTAAQSTYFQAPSFAKQNVTAGNKLQFIVTVNGTATAWVADVYVHCYYAY